MPARDYKNGREDDNNYPKREARHDLNQKRWSREGGDNRQSGRFLKKGEKRKPNLQEKNGEARPVPGPKGEEGDKVCSGHTL